MTRTAPSSLDSEPSDPGDENRPPWRPGAYARASAAMLGWLVLRAGLQAAMAVALARILGATQYGQFIATIAVAGFFAPLAGLGLQGVILRDGARDPRSIPTLLGGALALIAISLPLAWVAAAALAFWLLPPGIGIGITLLVLGVEIAATTLTELVGRTEQSLHRASRFGAIQTGLSLVRLAAFVPWLAFSHPSTRSWMVAYASSTAAYLALVLAFFYRRHVPRKPASAPWRLVAQGLPFAAGATAMRLQGELNKPLLAGLGWFLAADLSLSQRAVDLANLPLVAMQEALWSRVYASDDPQARLRRVAPPMLAAAALGAAVLALAAPLLALLLGPDYNEAVHALRLLAALPVVQLLRNLGNATLVANGHASVLTRVYLASGMVSAIMAVILIKGFGLDGAIAAAYIAELSTVAAQRLLQPRSSQCAK